LISGPDDIIFGPGDELTGIGETILALGHYTDKTMTADVDKTDKTTAGFRRPAGFEAFDFRNNT